MSKTNEYGENFARSLAAKRIKPATLAGDLGVKPQRITHWKKRGVAAKYAHRVAIMLDTNAELIANLEGADNLTPIEKRAAYAADLKASSAADMFAAFEATRQRLSSRDKLVLAKILISDAEADL